MKKMLNEIKMSLLFLPTPSNISIFWNMGSILGLCLMIQIISGFLLTMHYCPNTEYAFNSVIHIIQNVNYGWLIRNIHMNGASMYFICIYIHMFRGIYYKSYFLYKTWSIGVSILLISMMTAFLGYVLPWGQMSFWGATVITNLLSAIPYIGNNMVIWLWGNFSVSNSTLNRFFSLHFILPFIIMMLVMIHLMFLHTTGSSNPLGLNSNFMKINFHPYFTIKDIVGFILMLMFFCYLIFIKPYMFSDPDNFIPANPMITPIHIQPEWYFLFAYAILRSIPNKLGGVIALMLSIMILWILPIIDKSKMNSSFNPLNQNMFWLYMMSFFMLTWTGSQPIEYPYIQISQMFSIIYFMFFFILPISSLIWEKLLKI